MNRPNGTLRVLWWRDWKEKGQMKAPGLWRSPWRSLSLSQDVETVVKEPRRARQWRHQGGGFPSGQRGQTPSKGHRAPCCKVLCSSTCSATGLSARWSCTNPKALIKKGMSLFVGYSHLSVEKIQLCRFSSYFVPFPSSPSLLHAVFV